MNSWFTGILQLLGKSSTSFYGNILVKRGFVVLLIQFCGLILAFANSILLARLYGGQAYGIYALISTWCGFLSVLALFGMDDSHLVRLPGWKLQGAKRKIKRQLKWSLQVNTLLILLVSGVFYWILHVFSLPGLSGYAAYFNYGFLLVLLLTAMNNLLSFLRGMDQVIYGEIMDKLARPFLFILSLLAFFFLWRTDLVRSSLLAAAAGLLGVVFILAVKTGKTIKQQRQENDGSRASFSVKPNLRYLTINLLYFMATRIDILLMGLLAEAVLVGHYNVAVKFSDIASYPVAIVNLSLPTMLSAIKQEAGDEAAPRFLYRVARNSFFQCLALGLLFLVTGNKILNWYGQGFSDAYPVLLIFLLSNLISASIGSADVFFILDGQEKKPIYCRIFSLLLTIVLAFFLIPKWSMTGAAVSMLSGNIVYCALTEYFFFRQHGLFIHPFASKASARR